MQTNLKEFIDKKAKEECPRTAIYLVSSCIKKLSDYLDGHIDLTNTEIYNKIDYLVGCVSVTLDIPLEGLEFLRARKDKVFFKDQKELSYIKNPSANFPASGRFNKDSESLFYASIKWKKDNRALNVVLSEVNASECDKVSVLHSKQLEESKINVRILGIYDCVRRQAKPAYMSTEVFNYYNQCLKYMQNNFNSDLFLAYTLTDRFLADLAGRPGSDRLYRVTSEISSLLMHGEKCEGILYSSVQAKDEPVIVLKQECVDTKLKHTDITHVMVTEHLGYEFYKVEDKGERITL